MAILDECQIYLGGEGGGSRTVSGRRVINLNSRPLGTYEIKMAARTGEHLILTLLRKTVRSYEKSTRLRTNSFERMGIIPRTLLSRQYYKRNFLTVGLDLVSNPVTDLFLF